MCCVCWHRAHTFVEVRTLVVSCCCGQLLCFKSCKLKEQMFVVSAHNSPLYVSCSLYSSLQSLKIKIWIRSEHFCRVSVRLVGLKPFSWLWYKINSQQYFFRQTFHLIKNSLSIKLTLSKKIFWAFRSKGSDRYPKWTFYRRNERDLLNWTWPIELNTFCLLSGREAFNTRCFIFSFTGHFQCNRSHTPILERPGLQ